MSKDADVDRLTREEIIEIVARKIRDPHGLNISPVNRQTGHWHTAEWIVDELKGWRISWEESGTLAPALSQEEVREEVLEEVAQMAQDRAASEHDDFSEFAHDVRALKREPNAAAQAGQGFSSAPSHEGHAAGPAPAAPDVASMVKQAEQNAQYWLKAGYEEPHRDLAVLNVEQAMNAYKNAMYALLARLGQQVELLQAAHDLGWAHKTCPNCGADMMTGASDE